MKNPLSDLPHSFSPAKMMMRQCRNRKIVGESSRSDTNNAKKDPDNKKCFFTKLSLGKVVALNKVLTKEQKIAVESIGFGSILTLQCDTIRQSLCAWIVRNFDVSSTAMVIHGKKIQINGDDVEQILGLPNQGSSVPTDGPNDELIEELCRTFSVTDLIPLNLLGNKLEECKTHGDEFKRMYCIYILGYLLCPSSENGVKKGMLHAIKDVSKINTFNWAQFVLDTLANDIKALNLKSVRGCLFVLMIFFLEHVNPGKNLPPEHNMSPSICYWSNDKVAEKLDKFKAQGGYESPCACFVLDKRIVHKAGESVDLEKSVCELKSDMQDVKKDVHDIKIEFNKDFCEMKNLLHLILNSQTAKQSDGKIEETGDECGPTVVDEHASVDVIGDGDGIIVETPTAGDEHESVEKSDKNEQNVSEQSLIVSNKRLRVDGEFTDIPSSSSSMERYIQPQSKKEETLLNEVKKLDSEMNELRKSKHEEMEKRDEVIVRLESELFKKEHLVQCYREAFEELVKGVDEESICGQASEEGEVVEYKSPSHIENESVKSSNNKFIGVQRRGSDRKWQRIYLGTYETAEEAARAYDAANLCLKGSKAILNFPNSSTSISHLPPNTVMSVKTIKSIAEEAAKNTFLLQHE